MKKYNDGIRYTGAFAISPASDTAVGEHNGLLLDAADTVTVRFESGATAVALPLPAGYNPIRVYSVDSVAGSATVFGLV